MASIKAKWQSGKACSHLWELLKPHEKALKEISPRPRDLPLQIVKSCWRRRPEEIEAVAKVASKNGLAVLFLGEMLATNEGLPSAKGYSITPTILLVLRKLADEVDTQKLAEDMTQPSKIDFLLFMRAQMQMMAVYEDFRAWKETGGFTPQSNLRVRMEEISKMWDAQIMLSATS